ncbi:Spore germination protein A2 [Peribacillus sp. Bi96]|uniref:GerAB/ArcD/ProY family transporter n=1 Tax=Peribacillus sp. Bi96 TaxID=2884273 RepID=UPI001DB74A2E|nr:GerAB/ArcD/ProY family transporter [Peribacillus sp. Bi96]CAH0259364.1 Spore germination protein A2 [Peribacillus sp. Bi96]
MAAKSDQISTFLVFFLIIKIQIGVGILGYQRIIIQSAGNDAWIAVIISGIIYSFGIWGMYKVLNCHDMDLIGIQKRLFGKWLGGLLNIIWILYWLMVGISVLRSYLEIVQSWVFPQINTWLVTSIFALLIYYVVLGGFRVVTGICFLGICIPSYLILTFYFPLEYTHFRNLLPIWNHSFQDLALASKQMSYSYLGVSTLMMYYPLIKNRKSSQKWAQLGNLTTVLVYLFITILTIGFYSEGQISRYIWATLSFWGIVKMPFVERFEYIGIATWVLVLVPSVCLYIWVSARGISQYFNIEQKKIYALLLILLVVITNLIKARKMINQITDYVANIGLIMEIPYVLFLVCLSTVISKKRKIKK